jgi:hypothetical protein
MLAFRFAFVYFLLYFPPTVSWLLPGGGFIDRAYNAVAYPTVAWAATHVFGRSLPITIFSSGADRTYNYFEVLVLTIIAALACGLWSFLSNRHSHPSLYSWMRVTIRYVLALNMLSYGYGKLLRIQFPFPQLDRLLEPYGQTTPMGLLWTFMAYSPGYNIFAGAIEVTGAVLLFWERTTLLGALILVASLTNVVALDLAYDVPVRLYAMHLLAAALFLAAPHLARVFAALMVPSHLPKRRPLAVAKVAVIAAVLWAPTVQYRGLSASVTAPPSPRYGIWEVDTFVEAGEPRPLQFGDATVWRRLIVTEDGSLSVQTADDVVVQWRTTDRTADRTLELTGTRYPRDPRRRAKLRYDEQGSEHLTVEGIYDGRAVQATLHRVAMPQFELLTHPFHWINEYHHNR